MFVCCNFYKGSDKPKNYYNFVKCKRPREKGGFIE